MAEDRSGCMPLSWLIALLFSFFLGGISLGIQSPVDFTNELPPPTPATPPLEVVLAPAETGTSWEALQESSGVLERRLQGLSLSGQIVDSYTIDADPETMRITIRLSEGTMAIEDILFALTANGYLEFVDFSPVPVSALSDYVGTTIATTASVERTGDTAAQIVFPTVLTQDDIALAVSSPSEYSGYLVEIELTDDAGARLGAFSESHIGSGLAIVLDGTVLSIPIIQARIETRVIITGNFTESEADVLAAQINSKPLPVPLVVESVDTAP